MTMVGRLARGGAEADIIRQPGEVAGAAGHPGDNRCTRALRGRGRRARTTMGRGLPRHGARPVAGQLGRAAGAAERRCYGAPAPRPSDLGPMVRIRRRPSRSTPSYVGHPPRRRRRRRLLLTIGGLRDPPAVLAARRLAARGRPARAARAPRPQAQQPYGPRRRGLARGCRGALTGPGLPRLRRAAGRAAAPLRPLARPAHHGRAAVPAVQLRRRWRRCEPRPQQLRHRFGEQARREEPAQPRRARHRRREGDLRRPVTGAGGAAHGSLGRSGDGGGAGSGTVAGIDGISARSPAGSAASIGASACRSGWSVPASHTCTA